MGNALEYEVEAITNASTNFTSYKAYSPRHEKLVCIKSPTTTPASDNILFHLKNEFNLAKDLEIEGVRKAYDYTSFFIEF